MHYILFRSFSLFLENITISWKSKKKGRVVETRSSKLLDGQLADMVCEIGKIMGYDRVEARFRHEGVEFDTI